MMKLSTPASSQDPSRSFIQRCSVLRRTGALPAGAAGVAGTLLAVRHVRRPLSLRVAAPAAVALACLSLGATLVLGVLQVQRIECCWSEVRAERLSQDSSELKGALSAAVAEARRLAQHGMTAALLPREGAFERVRDAMHARSQTPEVERGVVILAPDGEPVAWAGRHRPRRRAAARVPRRAAGPLALARRGRGRMVRGPRADRLLPPHGGAVLARCVLPPRARGVQRVGRRAAGAWRGGALCRQRAVAARARAA